MAESPIPQPPLAYGEDRLEDGDGAERVLMCPIAKAWTPRKPRTLTTAEYPGTAVSWGGAIFEVRAVEPVDGGGIRYRLVPWQEGHAIRRMEAYDEASEASRAAEQTDRRDSVRARRLSILLAPLAGLLPGRVQQRMEGEFGAPAIAMTISSAAPLFVIGALGVFERFIGGLGGGLGFPVWLTPPAPIALYLFVESALRLGSALAMSQPMGSLPVVLAWEIWNEARRPPAEPARAEVAAEDRGAAERDLLDRFRMLEPLLSLLSPGEQSLLSERYGFEPVRWGKITAAILLVLCGSNVLAALVNAAAGRFHLVDAIWLIAGGALTLEQIARWRRLAIGSAAGSVLGVLVRPMAKRLLASGPRRESR